MNSNNNNKELTKDILEGISFILMTIAIIGLICVLYEVKELKRLTKDASNFRIVNRK